MSSFILLESFKSIPQGVLEIFEEVCLGEGHNVLPPPPPPAGCDRVNQGVHQRSAGTVAGHNSFRPAWILHTYKGFVENHQTVLRVLTLLWRWTFWSKLISSYMETKSAVWYWNFTNFRCVKTLVVSNRSCLNFGVLECCRNCSMYFPSCVFLISVTPLTTEFTENKTTPKICKITVIRQFLQYGVPDISFYLIFNATLRRCLFHLAPDLKQSTSFPGNFTQIESEPTENGVLSEKWTPPQEVFYVIIGSWVRGYTEHRNPRSSPERVPEAQPRALREGNVRGFLCEVEPRAQLLIGLEFFQTIFLHWRKETSTKTALKMFFFSCGQRQNCPSWSLTTTRMVLQSRSQSYFRTIFPQEIVHSQKAQVNRLRILELVALFKFTMCQTLCCFFLLFSFIVEGFSILK